MNGPIALAPLLRFVADVDVAAETFTNKVERLALSLLRGAPSPAQLESISEDVGRLPQEIRQRTSKINASRLALSPDLATASRAQLTELIRELAPEMKNKRRVDNPFIAIRPSGLHCNRTARHRDAERDSGSCRRVPKDQRILRIADEHPALRALREGQSPTQDQLIDLERLIHNELESPDIEFTDKAARAVYGLKWDNHVGFLDYSDMCLRSTRYQTMHR
jgi:type I restriction enzyme, R subunit